MKLEATKFRPREVVKHVLQTAAASLQKILTLEGHIAEDVPIEVRFLMNYRIMITKTGGHLYSFCPYQDQPYCHSLMSIQLKRKHFSTLYYSFKCASEMIAMEEVAKLRKFCT